jgi:large subunit ribosomal protein L10
LPTEQKKEKIAVLSDKLGRSKAAVFTVYQSEALHEGLKMEAITGLRRQLQDVNADYHVVKNTLLKLALEQAGSPTIGTEKMLTGPTAVALCYGDVAESIRRLIDFAKVTPLFTIKGGVFEGRVLAPAQVVAITTLPPREVLIAQVLGGIQAPISGLVGVLSGTLRSLVNVVEARRKQLEEGTAGA